MRVRRTEEVEQDEVREDVEHAEVQGDCRLRGVAEAVQIAHQGAGVFVGHDLEQEPHRASDGSKAPADVDHATRTCSVQYICKIHIETFTYKFYI